jgi:hypothetical protein
MADFGVHGNEPLGSVEAENFFYETWDFRGDENSYRGLLGYETV